MSRWCGGCALSRQQVSPSFRSCKPFRLCLEVDISLVYRYPGRDLEEYREMAREIELGYWRSARVARGPFPATGNELLQAALKIHEAIFQNASPEIAGRLRTRDVYFGIHRLKGVQPAEIVRSFGAMSVQLPPPGDRSLVAAWGARMLHRFFAIHPFEDGNGRVARRLLEWGVEMGDRWAFVGYPRTSSREVRGYVQALRYADRHAPNSENWEAKPFLNHLKYLTRWLEARIAEKLDLEEAAEPPSGSALGPRA